VSEVWLHESVEVRPSDIAGRGLFSTTDLPAGTPVARLPGRESATTELAHGNHSCDPTLGWSDATTLVTRRAVAAGEELTHDYAASTIDEDLVLFCHCGAYGCRQAVEGTDWRIPALQRRYAGSWHPVVAARIADTA
jgi:hypothetical protein